MHASTHDIAMLWVGRLLCPNVRWWASKSERPNRQHCHLHENKNKKITALTFFSNRRCFRIHSLTNFPRPHHRGLLHHDCAAAPTPPRPQCNDVLHRPEHHRMLSCLPTATHHSPLSSWSQRGVVHGDCSRTTFFTTPSHLPASIIPLHCTRVSLAGYRNSPPGRLWLLAAPYFVLGVFQ